METPTTHPRARIETIVLAVLIAIVVLAAASRREFNGDGVRHLPAALSGSWHFGEARWLLFPPLLTAVLRPLAALGLLTGVEAAIQPLLWLDVACGIVIVMSVDTWLRAECGHPRRRAAALLLAGSCAPFLMLFSDTAEAQIPAALAVAGLTYARTHQRHERGAIVAIVSIAAATLVYEGIVLAMGMLPLVVPRAMRLHRRVLIAFAGAAVSIPLVLIAAQAAEGLPLNLAARSMFGGERNPLARSLMAQPSFTKFVAAVIAGPPQGIVALKDFAGLPALFASWRGAASDARTEPVANLLRLISGLAIVSLLLVTTLRRRDWRLLFAAAILLVLPVGRNQQYAYLKFFVLWPVVVALAAVHCRPRTIAVTAAIVLASNGWILAEQIDRGRRHEETLRSAFVAAAPDTCWMTIGWAPPMWYLWPGTSAPVLGTLATGSDPAAQASALTASLRRCFCDSSGVWTDTSSRDRSTVAALATHFEYGVVDLTTILLPGTPRSAGSFDEIRVYPPARQQEVCRTLSQLQR